MDNQTTPVDALVIDLGFDPDVLTYDSCEPGALTTGWAMFNCNEPSSGMLSVAGFTTGTAIPAGSNGSIAVVHFTVDCPACVQSDTYPVTVDGLDDDIIGFTTNDGLFTYDCSSTPVPTNTPGCVNHGDVTLDGSISAGDAQLCFNIVLGVHIPTFEEECAADCNGDGSVSAGDAQEIFFTVLGMGSCVDPMP